MYRVYGCVGALLAVLAFATSSSRVSAGNPTGQAEFIPLPADNWEIEARKILVSQNVPEAEIERAIESARAAQRASEGQQAGTLQMIPLSEENWEAEARALLSKENRSKAAIDDVIEKVRRKLVVL
jgi:hypothetical protein